jgi:predicted RecA/RadA family phage recombinase
MNTLKFDGKTIDYANSSGSTIASGAVVDLTNYIAIAINDIPDLTSGPCTRAGVHELAAEDDTAWVQGEALYWTGTLLTSTPGSDTPAGTAHAAKAETATTGLVNIADAAIAADANDA